MSKLARLIVLVGLMTMSPLFALADEGYYPIRADDGSVIANHRVPTDLESQIEKLPGVVVVGNPKGVVTLNEFYDLNCPYCRKASDDIDALLKSHPELRLVMVPFPVLGIPSIQASRVELAVAQSAPPEKFYEFVRKVYAGRGMVDGNRAFSAAKSIGLDVDHAATGIDLADTMIAHVRLGDALEIAATPGFVIKGVAIVGYPGPGALARIIEAVERCDAVICEGAAR